MIWLVHALSWEIAFGCVCAWCLRLTQTHTHDTHWWNQQHSSIAAQWHTPLHWRTLSGTLWPIHRPRPRPRPRPRHDLQCQCQHQSQCQCQFTLLKRALEGAQNARGCRRSGLQATATAAAAAARTALPQLLPQRKTSTTNATSHRKACQHFTGACRTEGTGSTSWKAQQVEGICNLRLLLQGWMMERGLGEG